MRSDHPKRARARWLDGAPDYIADVFDHPNDGADRYTIFFAYPYSETNGAVMYLGTSESGHVSGSSDMMPHEFSQYRYENGRRRIRWLDLPEQTRAVVARWHNS